VNGDGYDDVLVGAIWYSNGQSHEGAIFLYLGSATGPSGTVAWSVESNVANRNFGTSMGTAGDVNGDGYDDVIIGDPLHSNGQTNEGGAYLYLGSATGLSPTPVWSAESNQAEARFGTSVGTAGDVNGDGYADVIVGAPYYSAGQTNEGRAYVYLGSASGLASNPAWLADGQQDFARLGSSVGSAGDVNGDGYADAVVGAPFYSNGQAYEGRAYLFLGSAAGLPFTVGDWVVESDQVTAGFGAAVATAGDVNGDGFADVLVSASNFDNGGGIYGRLFAFYGNGGRGVTMRPRQRRSDDTAPIAPGGRSLAPGSFRIAAIGRTPFGRGRVRLEWEVKPLGTLFNGLGTQSSLTPIDTGTAGASLNELVSGLDSGAYHWRARLLYDTATTPLARKNRWFRVPWSGWQEMDLRLAALLGGWVWDDLDGDGMKQAGEPGHAGVVVNLKNPAGTTVDQRTTLADGFYNFGLAATGQFGLQFVVPAGTTLTLQDQGGDDAADSDANRVSGLTPLAGPTFTAADGTGWSAGLLTCGPLSPTTILGVRIAPGTAAVTIDFTDPNPPGLVLGYNLYRASQPQPSPELWVQLAYEVTDSDPASPNIQCMDPTSDIPPLGGVFYYKVTASNHVCGTEGPL
jgi:hypothetical protein